MKKEFSSVKNRKEVFSQTALGSVNSIHSVTALLSRSLSRRLFLGKLQSDIYKPRQGNGEKGNVFR